MHIRRVAVAGVGLVGASLSRAIARALPDAEIVGYDPAPPRAGVSTGITRWAAGAEEAMAEADLVVLAAPIPAILDLLPVAARACRPQALVTDTGSTKAAICEAARAVFAPAGGAHFVGGHPMAGSERGGAAASDPDLLRGAPYALCAVGAVPAEKKRAFENLLRAVGSRPLWVEPAEHDRIVARVSHLPQLAVVALASLLEEAAGREPAVAALAGSGLRDLLRLASSPYPIWRDICRTNAAPLRQALESLAERLRGMAAGLEDGRLEEPFERARRFRDERLKGGAE